MVYKGIKDTIMTTSYDPTNPEKEEKVSSSNATQPGGQGSFFTPKYFADHIIVRLPIGDNNSPVEAHLFTSPSLCAAVQSYLKQQHAVAEWNFLREISEASKLSPEEQKQKAQMLLQKYITAPKTEEYTLNFSDIILKEMKANVEAGHGLDSFIPITAGMTELLNNLLPHSGGERPKQIAIYRAAYEHDKSMLPIRTVISNALSTIKEIEENEVKAKKEEVAKALKSIDEIEKKEKGHQKTNSKPLALFDKKIPEEVETSNQKMEMIHAQLNQLLEASAAFGNTPSAIEQKLTELTLESGLLKDLDGLVAKLGPDNRHAQKITAFLETLDNIKLDIQKSKNLIVSSSSRPGLG